MVETDGIAIAELTTAKGMAFNRHIVKGCPVTKTNRKAIVTDVKSRVKKAERNALRITFLFEGSYFRSSVPSNTINIRPNVPRGKSLNFKIFCDNI